MKILVTGATRNIGRLVVDELLRLGATDIRALTTDPTAAALPVEVEVATGFVGNSASLHRALQGVDTLYLAPHPPTVGTAVALAEAAGVQRIVDLAGGAGTGWEVIEEAVETSAVPWTHLEPGEFMDNYTMWADQIRSTGQVRDGYAAAANAAIALPDIAAVAAQALLDDSYVGQRLELTGPECLRRDEKLQAIAHALGRDIDYVELDPEEAVAALEPAMGEYARWYLEGVATLIEHPQLAVPTVAEVTGRAATTFAEWAEANVEQFR
ncbi:NAD(P)H-binding protein [Antrihabitans sp. YC2-6]|uniref:NAD(P)H-binding protein n=1 Tax=Antrihabitans sp. YC2-6 TaxID=2799498 RepID=UPI0018F7B5F2|nr:NAD(P)H-binding protein [Antrihabitans sp. YC2-6]MBJ8344943.1 NAD(P)H-binding protein [Antrihabitans sp. YC2-6]